MQLYPKARSAIKYLVEDGRYDYVETGFLMSIKKNVKDILIPSEEQHIDMHPMDFIKKLYETRKPLGQAMHRKVMDYFIQYMIVGGMPQEVQEYLDTRDFNKEARFREYEDAMFWLKDAMIMNPCYNSTEPSIGLKLNTDFMTLKCYMADTGLLISHSFDEKGIMTEEIYKKILFDKLEFNEGMIMENIVAQMLVASGHKLYFYSNPSREDSSSRMEIDFLIAKSKISSRHNISPIEVKSGKNYTISSLNKFIQKYKEELYIPYVLHTRDIKEENGILYLPIYMASLL